MSIRRSRSVRPVVTVVRPLNVRPVVAIPMSSSVLCASVPSSIRLEFLLTFFFMQVTIPLSPSGVCYATSCK